MNEENNKKVFQCICGKQFDNNKSLSVHKGRCKIYQAEQQKIKQQELEARRLPNGMFLCEKCGKEHDGSYGSGRFCCKSCYKSFTSKYAKNTEKFQQHLDNMHNSKRAPYGTWKCKYCGLIFKTRHLMNIHIFDIHRNKYEKHGKGQPAWNKGLTQETDERVAKGINTLCERYKLGEIQPAFKGKHHTIESKKKLSIAMKKAHNEGRANNFALSRHKYNGMSYPEKWFMGVIKNEFKDKNFVREYPFIKYSLDFAWPHKKICIEIDGLQHYDPRFQDRIDHDIKRDIFIKSKGWKILRLRWTYVLKQKQYWIKIAKDFVDNLKYI